MSVKRTYIAVASILALSGPFAVFAQTTNTPAVPIVVPKVTPNELLLAAKVAEQAAAAAELTGREKILLGALILSATVMVMALMAMLRTRRTFRKKLNEHRDELRKAFADAYIGMKDGTLDAKRVREAERAIERIVNDLEHYLD